MSNTRVIKTTDEQALRAFKSAQKIVRVTRRRHGIDPETRKKKKGYNVTCRICHAERIVDYNNGDRLIPPTDIVYFANDRRSATHDDLEVLAGHHVLAHK